MGMFLRNAIEIAITVQVDTKLSRYHGNNLLLSDGGTVQSDRILDISKCCKPPGCYRGTIHVRVGASTAETIGDITNGIGQIANSVRGTKLKPNAKYIAESHDEIWVVSDESFTIQPGSMVEILCDYDFDKSSGSKT